MTKWMLDRYGEPKEVEVYTREIRYTETWARALDNSFQTTVQPYNLYDSEETLLEANKICDECGKYKDDTDECCDCSNWEPNRRGDS